MDARSTVEILADPIAGPSVSMRDAYRLVKAAGATQIVPIHYDAFIAKPEQFAEKYPVGTVHVLADGASVDLTPAEHG